MNIQMNTAVTTMRELQKKVDVIANNISNVNTNGYKRRSANFSDALVQSIEKQAGTHEIGRQTPNGIRVGSGAVITQTSLNMGQGSVLETNRSLDFAIQGQGGFFRIGLDGNTHYTKDGSFQIQPIPNSNRVNLVTSSGHSILDNNGQPIAFDDDHDTIQVNNNGTIVITYKDPLKQPTQFQLGIAEINRPDLLRNMGGNLYQLPDTEGENLANGTLQLINLAEQNDGSIRIIQGALEMSNVDLTEEMTELIATQRLLQSQGRAISFADDMMGLVNTMRG